MRGKPELIQLRDKAGNLKSPYWYIQYYEGRSKRVSTGYFIGKEDHEANLALSQFTLERERPKSKEPNQLMIATALKDYYDEHIQYTASKDNAGYYEDKLRSFFGVMMVSDITQGKINQYVREGEAKKWSNGTIRRQLEHLQGALNHAVREQRLLYAPQFKKPPAPPARDNRLSSAQINRILEHCKSDHVKDFIILMLETAQRPGAVESLTWFQVDFENEIINFDKTGKKQTNKRVRPVAMTPVAYQVLKRLHKVKQTEYVLEYTPTFGKHAIPAGCVRKAFERACEEAGVEASRYTLRHTAIDDLDEIGVDEKTSSDIAGHTNQKTTRRHYIKTKLHKQREALELASKQRKYSAKAKKRKS